MNPSMKNDGDRGGRGNPPPISLIIKRIKKRIEYLVSILFFCLILIDL
jgi:hypothetical protein